MKKLIVVAKMSFLSLVLGFFGCDSARIENLKEGVSTEAEVRQQFGEPQAIHAELDGGQTFEYSRQPEGQVAYMITLGPSGTLRSARQVLNPQVFATVTPGMDATQVRRILGKPAKKAKYALKPHEEHWEWRWRDGQQSKVFTVTFGPTGQVVSTATSNDPGDYYRG